MQDGKRPKIGVTTSPKRETGYYLTYGRAVEAAGAEAVYLPVGASSIAGLDGLLLPGGWDVDPARYGEKPDTKIGDIDPELDETEIRLFNEARHQKIPVLGLCRGQQVINVAMGGSLIQHLEGHEARAFGRKHLAHAVAVDPASELGQAAEGPQIQVNSLHHQAVRSVAQGLRQTATGDDGTIEGLESDDGLIVAVQCHPEELTGELPWARSLFERFIGRARGHSKKG